MTRRRGRKKKDRPSLLDLQKRNLRSKKQQEEQESLKRKRRNPNPSPSNSSRDLRLPNSTSGRISTRRNPNPSTSDRDEDVEEEKTSRKEKKLLSVLDAALNSPDRAEKEANGGARAMGEDAEPGPTTPMPHNMLLITILERLQRKDKYGVFSEPVDPEELPDYHDIIEHPMDFGTIRKKLDKGEYANLEKFESDIFLICSNAMVYNASDTVYLRQARSIQEHAKKDFAKLRAESENREQEPKLAPRRGRPPTKKPGRSPVAKHMVADPSPDVMPSNARTNGHSPAFSGQDLPHKQPDKAVIVNPSKDLYGLMILENNGSGQHRLERNVDFSGFGFKGGWSKWGNSLIDVDESRRSAYNHTIPSDAMQERPFFTIFDSEKKALIPVGIHQPHAYSCSLARFAAKLSLTAWEIVAKRIEQVLPPGTKFGRSWVGETEGSHETHPPK